jgi:hypothetical protein
MSATCSFCGEPVLGDGSAHWMCGGYLPVDRHERPIAAADHIVRLLERKTQQGKQLKRRPWTRDQLWYHMRPELTPHFESGLALALDAGRVRWQNGALTLAPVRTARRRTCEPTEGLFEIPL